MNVLIPANFYVAKTLYGYTKDANKNVDIAKVVIIIV